MDSEEELESEDLIKMAAGDMDDSESDVYIPVIHNFTITNDVMIALAIADKRALLVVLNAIIL